MFGDRPALSPPEIFYQRMLAGDPAEAADHAEQFLKKRSLLAYYETVTYIVYDTSIRLQSLFRKPTTILLRYAITTSQHKPNK